MDFLNIREEDGWKLLEEVTINDRSLVVFYSPNTEMISLMVFHLTDRPNEISKRSPYTTWGYLTFYVSEMQTCEEAAKITGLYLQDLENEKYWWEEIN